MPRLFARLLSLALVLAAARPVAAQATAPPQSTALTQSAPRDFAPGVETVVPPSLDPAETVTKHDVVELLADDELRWDPQLLADRPLVDDARGARFTRTLWCFEFGFKPLRMIRFIDPSTESGQRLVWYLVYRVKNTGAALRPEMNEADGAFTAVAADSGPLRFVPHFVLQGHDVAPEGGKIYRAYLDQDLPGTLPAIARREARDRRLHSSASMPLESIPVGEERWGVAMWSDIDPEIDFFSVFVRGLTNAYEWTDPPGAFAAGDPPGKGREFVRKTLQLNFWRPGDRFLQHENEVRYGVAPGKGALYGVEEGVAYRWVYR